MDLIKGFWNLADRVGEGLHSAAQAAGAGYDQWSADVDASNNELQRQSELETQRDAEFRARMLQEGNEGLRAMRVILETGRPPEDYTRRLREAPR